MYFNVSFEAKITSKLILLC